MPKVGAVLLTNKSSGYLPEVPVYLGKPAMDPHVGLMFHAHAVALATKRNVVLLDLRQVVDMQCLKSGQATA